MAKRGKPPPPECQSPDKRQNSHTFQRIFPGPKISGEYRDILKTEKEEI
jgi:hypothetical protein